MPAFQSLAATRSRGLRASTPKTPEPHAENDNEHELPSPPRQRLRLRKRNASQLTAPTEQFLASVAAADIPIPSIEEPCVLDEDMVDIAQYNPILEDSVFAGRLAPGRIFSPPKTPVPTALPLSSPNQYPEWNLGSAASSPESSPESSRPSTARSTHTSASLFSQYSITSEELSQCVSPDTDKSELPSNDFLSVPDDGTSSNVQAPQINRRRRAPWTKAMSQHLWSTYMLYLQDPKVTPVRVAKSGVPPHGVCLRVSREARRSWKGSKAQQNNNARSRNATPTGESAGAFVQWPHTGAATRAHLRELCKSNAATTTRNLTPMGRSPTPFSRMANRLRNRRSTPARSCSIFSGTDMAMSLAVSTSDSMQPQGPLARLAQADFNADISETQLQLPSNELAQKSLAEQEPARARLGSPFTARSYGPSSSNTLAESLRLNLEEQRQNQTVGPWRNLGSPARLTRSQSSTQKRRSRQTLLESRRAKRPTLAADFWTEPTDENIATAVQPLLEFSSTASTGRDNLFVPRTNVQELFETSQLSLPTARLGAAGNADSSQEQPPARLGSPFSASSSSWSFPNRITNAYGSGIGAIRRPFSSVQKPAERGEASATKSSLASRLAYIDERLKDFRRRSQSRRRSHSPA